MRHRTLSLLFAFVLVPALTLACAGADTESAESEDAAAEEAATMEAEPAGEDAMEEGAMEEEEGDMDEGEEGAEHADSTSAAPDTAATGN